MYIVIGGGGKIGEALVSQFLLLGHEVAIMEANPERARHLANMLSGRFMVVSGDVCDVDVMRDAGMEDADVLCAVTGQDDTNLAMCEIAQTIFKVPRLISRVCDPRNERIFKHLGITGVSSSALIARMVSEEATASENRAVLNLVQLKMVLMAVDIPTTIAYKSEGGRRLGDMAIPEKAKLVQILTPAGLVEPTPDTLVMPGDTVVLAVPADLEDATRASLLEL